MINSLFCEQGKRTFCANTLEYKYATDIVAHVFQEPGRIIRFIESGKVM